MQITWLNDFHRRCEDTVGQYLLDRNKQEAYDWLVARTTSVPVFSSSNSIGRRNNVVWLFLSSLAIMLWAPVLIQSQTE